MNDPRLRIAQLIRDQLLIARQHHQRGLLDQLQAISTDMNQYQKLCHRMARADRLGLNGAAARLQRRIDHLLTHARYSLEAADRAVRSSSPPLPTLHDLFRELDQLDSELGPWTFDPTDRTVSVNTEDITLEDVPLGPFAIRLQLGDLATMDRRLPFTCVALAPHPAASAEHVSHPHVSDQVLCAGDATVSLRHALATGRLCDFFVMVRQVLTTYNPASPYVPLDQWDGRACYDCGQTVGDEDCYYCESCQHEYCQGCSACCGDCGEIRCLSCQNTCAFCDEVFCDRCIGLCPHCHQPCCPDCLENDQCPSCHEQKEPVNEQDQSTPAVGQRPTVRPTSAFTGAA
jgi:hypothetical protein